jgi:ureidoacrylate peracid hydrolase
MHKINLPQSLIDRVMERRGNLHVHDNLDPRRTALIVVDMQHAFLTKELAAAYVPGAVDIIPNINKLARVVRETGGKVVWIQNTVNEYALETWSEWFGMFRGTPDEVRRRVKNMAVGSRGHEIHHDLDVKPVDSRVLKQRFSAFLPGSSGLTDQFRAEGIDTVIITGTVTNCCCESSARDAMMYNFKVIMVSDGNATWTDEEHNATLSNIYSIFGDVMDTDYLMGRLRNNAIQRAAE